MFLLRRIICVVILKLFLIQLVTNAIISFRVGEITYEYDNETKPLGKGSFATVFKGARKVGNETEIVAFKELYKLDNCRDLKSETAVYEKIGSHDSVPKLYQYYSVTNQNQIMITEMLGENLRKLFKKLRRFSTVTVLRIGLQVLEVIEHIHKMGVIHNDIQDTNLAIGYKNHSRIYALDFNGSKNYTFSKSNDVRRFDLVRLAHVLIGFAQGDYLNNKDDDGELDDEADCLGALEIFLQKAQHPTTEKPDYEELKQILSTELEKHKNETNYDKFDWEK